ncbi:MAG: hypothetical protein HC892_23400, partial [Saprospiraceae bacterium]|nr:hypothetical protein [Saprospiraceae bacterium]
MQVVDYFYNDQRWLKQINTPFPITPVGPTERTVADPEDLFYLDLNYDLANASLSAPAQRNGNISFMRWQVKGGNLQGYGFEYDFLDRLREAHFAEQVGSIQSTDNAFGTSYVYDLRGNITRLKRNGKYGSTVAVIDDLTYSYDTFNGNTNQLKNIRDDAPCPDNLVISSVPQRTETYRAAQAIRFLPGFTFSAIESGELVAKIGCAAPTYTKGYVDRSTNPVSSNRYDANGNLTYDVDKNFGFEYNHLNLPYRATYNADFEANTIFNQIEWLYDASGRKWQKQLKRLFLPFETKDYLGALEY